MVKPLELTGDQLRSFRAKRSHLIGEGAPDLVTCARELLGAQAQVDTCAFHALSLRTQGRPSAAQVRALIFEGDHTLVRTWGQRDTLHLYDAQDWPLIIAARTSWVQTGRRGGYPPAELIEALAQVFAQANRPLVRTDLFEHIPQDYIDSLADHPGAGSDPTRFAATRLVWCLATQGHITFGAKVGSQNSYAHRSLWHHALEWPNLESATACIMATRRYLSAFGPSTPNDIAHYMGARVSEVKAWLPLMEDELIDVKADGKSGLLALKEDAEELAKPAATDWPARLLPGYDTMLMTHKDKRWILPDAAEEKLVWRKAAVVMPVVIARGQIAATWGYKSTTKNVSVTVEPMKGWDDAMRPDVERDAQALADHLELTLEAVTIEA